MYNITTIDLAVDLLKAAKEFLPILQDPKKIDKFIQGAEEAKATIEQSAQVKKDLAKIEQKEAFNVSESERLAKITDEQAKKQSELTALQTQNDQKEKAAKALIAENKAIEKANALVLVNAEALKVQAADTQAKADIALEEALKLKAEYTAKLNSLIQVEVKNG